jgi:hypothetical protein
MIPAAGVRPRDGRSRAAGRGRSRVMGRQDGAVAPRLFPDVNEAPKPAATDVAVPRPTLPDSAQDSGESALVDSGAEPTLEKLICELWNDVLNEGRAVCPLCGGEMVGRASPHARPTQGRCGNCGTTVG